jgi:CHRD domain-containing protein
MSPHGDKARAAPYYRRVRKILIALASVLAVAACGGGSTASTPPSLPTVNFTMTTQNASGVSGTGQIVKSADSFTVTVKLSGMKPNSTHVSHLHSGSCAIQGGIAYALQSVVADSAGAATTTSTVKVPYSFLPASGWYVNVHNGPDFTEPDYAPSVTCGDLSAN